MCLFFTLRYFNLLVSTSATNGAGHKAQLFSDNKTEMYV